jgi:diguanylate cyclase (GGDEF)-like protein
MPLVRKEENGEMSISLSGTDARMDREQEFLAFIESGSIVPFFQPIVDLYLGDVYGWEVLSRAKPRFSSPEQMFSLAESLGLLWDLERACRTAALHSIAEQASGREHCTYFINVSPRVFSDSRFRRGFTLETLQALGIDQDQIVIEITESNKVQDYGLLEEVSRHYTSQGFRIALDDFGAGHSSLLTLVACSPHFIKLDRAIVAGIDADLYKQKLVRSIVSFAASVETRLVAEGVETVRELTTLVRLGIRYAQGFLLASSAPVPAAPDPSVRSTVRDVAARYHYPRSVPDTSITSIVMRPPTFEGGSLCCEDLDVFFRQSPAVDHVVVLDGGRVRGLVTKHHFYTVVGGPFGYQLYQKKHVEELARGDTLTVQEGMGITVLGRLAMSRRQAELYDPVLVEDASGHFLGTITMKQLLTQSIDLELQIATNANPLTGLPGNALIQTWLQGYLEEAPFSVVYGDLDRFKEYNDCYGFPQGDEMIKLAARILKHHAGELNGEANLGHIGGDDFLLIMDSLVEPRVLEAICRDFDEQKKALFQREDLEKGRYRSVDRRGRRVDVPLVTLSLAVVTSENVPQRPFSGQVGQVAASLKKKVKEVNARTGRSGWLVDRRRVS